MDGGHHFGQGASSSLKQVGWLVCGWYRLFMGVANNPGWGADACGQWGHCSWVWKAGSLWPPLGVCSCLFLCLHLCLCGHCHWVLGAVIVGVVGVVGVVVVMGIVVGIAVIVVVGVVVVVVIVIVGVGISRCIAVVVVVVVVVVVEAMVMVGTCHI